MWKNTFLGHVLEEGTQVEKGTWSEMKRHILCIKNHVSKLEIYSDRFWAYGVFNYRWLKFASCFADKYGDKNPCWEILAVWGLIVVVCVEMCFKSWEAAVLKQQHNFAFSISVRTRGFLKDFCQRFELAIGHAESIL